MSKTIFLQPEDKSPEAIKKINHTKSKSIDLAIPETSAIFNEKELKNLFEFISKKNISITLISNDNTGLQIAQKIGLPIKSTNPQVTINSKPSNKIKIIYKKGKSKTKDIVVKKNTNTSPQKKEKEVKKVKPSFLSQLLFGFLTILSIIVIITVFLIIVPTTKISITTQVDSIPVNYSFTLDTEQKNVDFINGVIPSQSITIDEELTQESRATGEKNDGTPASGTITVYNQSQSELPLVGNTRFLSTGGVLFRSTNAVNVPAGGSANVTVVADEAGSQGNISPSKFTLPALPDSGSYFYGQSSANMTGGADNIIYYLSDTDIHYSTDEIRQSLYNMAINDLINKLPAGRKYISPDIQDIQIETSTDAKVGDQVDTFNIKAKTTVTFIVYDDKDLTQLTTNNLSKQISKERVFVSNGIDDMSVTVKEIDVNDGFAKLDISTNALSAPLYNTDIIKSEISGKSKEQVKEYFLQYPEIQQIDIEFWPDWVKRVSNIPSRIYIDIVW